MDICGQLSAGMYNWCLSNVKKNLKVIYSLVFQQYAELLSPTHVENYCQEEI